MTSLVTECSLIHRIMLGYANTVQFFFVMINELTSTKEQYKIALAKVGGI